MFSSGRRESRCVCAIYESVKDLLEEEEGEECMKQQCVDVRSGAKKESIFTEFDATFRELIDFPMIRRCTIYARFTSRRLSSQLRQLQRHSNKYCMNTQEVYEMH